MVCYNNTSIEDDGDVLCAGYPGSLPYPPAGGYPRKLLKLHSVTCNAGNDVNRTISES